ncbi:MAG: STAS domain-containing protein [Gemmobacter sp.]|nr:STAS domain-containing protein [Gemmobacter sp.]
MSQTDKELQGALRGADAAALRAELAEALAQGDVRIGTDGLTAVDTAIVQVLLSARQTAAQTARTLHIDIPSGGTLAAMIDRLALRAAFDPSPGDGAAA